jgi:hypothetical protein
MGENYSRREAFKRLGLWSMGGMGTAFCASPLSSLQIRTVQKNAFDEKKLELIKEEVIEVSANRQFIANFFTDEQMKEISNYEFAYLIYIDEQPPKLIEGWFDHQQPDLNKKGFITFIHKHKPDCFFDLVFLIEFYRRSIAYHDRNEWSVDLPGWPKQAVFEHQHPVIDEILKESKGYLFWDYQLKNLIRLFCFDSQKDAEIAKGVRKRLPEIISLLADWQITDRLNLRQVIDERGWVGNPNIEGAFNISKLIGFDNDSSTRLINL